MPTPKRPVNKKKQSFFARLIPTTRKAKIITFAAAFVVIGGGVMVYRSFAATSADYTSGVLEWLFDGSRKNSNRVSTNGTICVDTLGYDTGPEDTSAGWFNVGLYALKNGKWQLLKETKYQLTKNYNRTDFDRVCWRGLTTAYVYRVQFDPFPSNPFLPDRSYARLTYKVHGYDKANGQSGATAGTTKNPQENTPPSNVTQPQPSK